LADRRPPEDSLFGDEAAQGVLNNQLASPQVRRLAEALGTWLRGNRSFGDDFPVVALAGDGRPETLELQSAAAEGLRHAGCHLVSIGEASAPALAMAAGYWQTDGAMLVGNPLGQKATAGVKFWTSAGQPVSRGHGLHDIERHYQTPVARPARRAGSRRHLAANEAYLDRLLPWFAGLRPLRIALQTCCAPVAAFLDTLTARSACTVSRAPWSHAGPLQQEIAREKAHVGFRIVDDGEIGQAFDDRGRPVPANVLLRLLLCEAPEAAMATPRPAADESLLLPEHPRAATWRTLVERRAALAGQPSGRFWHDLAGLPVADGLATLARLLQVLSRSDRRFSEAIDDLGPVD
jgi:hypothetical protein